jgi:sec-independent protein translocase protein TatA
MIVEHYLSMNSLALLPNLAGPDGLIILLLLVFFFGAKKLPEMARGLGSAIKEFSKAKNEDDKPVPPANLT